MSILKALPLPRTTPATVAVGSHAGSCSIYQYMETNPYDEGFIAPSSVSGQSLDSTFTLQKLATTTVSRSPVRCMDVSTYDTLPTAVLSTEPDSQAFNFADTSLDVWATTSQTLDMGAGDGEEHAIMLHNFLLWLDNGGSTTSMVAPSSALSPVSADLNPLAKTGEWSGSGWKTYLVLGRAQPEGETVYVLRQFRTNTSVSCVLIDATAGRAYVAEDDTCPLRSVGMVVSTVNCWANIQPDARPWRMSWDLDDLHSWAPMFTNNTPHPGPDVLPTIQSPVLYRQPDIKLAWALESEIHSTICTQLRAWRPRYVTRVRGDLTMQLKGLLLELEARACGIDGPTTVLTAEGPISAGTQQMRSSMSAATSGAVKDLAAEHQATLERLANRFRVQGFPLHSTFTEMEALTRLVHGTGAHRIEDENVQYGIAVAVLPYPNMVFSVWMYVVVLQPHVNVTQNA